MILIQLEEDGELVLNAFAEDRSHADLTGRLFAVLVLFDDILGLGAERDGDVHRALKNAVNQLVVKRRDLAPCGVAIAAALGDVALHIQQTAFTRPGMRQRVDDEELDAGLFGKVNRFEVSCRAVGSTSRLMVRYSPTVVPAICLPTYREPDSFSVSMTQSFSHRASSLSSGWDAFTSP